MFDPNGGRPVPEITGGGEAGDDYGHVRGRKIRGEEGVVEAGDDGGVFPVEAKASKADFGEAGAGGSVGVWGAAEEIHLHISAGARAENCWTNAGEADDGLAHRGAHVSAGVAVKLGDGDAGKLDVIDLTESREGGEQGEAGEFKAEAGAAFDFGLALFVDAGVEDVPVILGDFGGGRVGVVGLRLSGCDCGCVGRSWRIGVLGGCAYGR